MDIQKWLRSYRDSSSNSSRMKNINSINSSRNRIETKLNKLLTCSGGSFTWCLQRRPKVPLTNEMREHRLIATYVDHSIGLAVCLVNMEVTIVSTSLLTISNDFGDFDQSNWIVIAYLSTYSGQFVSVYT